jgi:hypothetical protein
MASYIDQFSAESLLVIKKPPNAAPSIVPFKSNGDNNFLEDRFICFAYRYEYSNGEFSATSQFSPPAFISGVFRFSIGSFLNNGMLNTANAVNITYDTGGPLVKGIELLFKEINDPTIKIIERINKLDAGFADNSQAVYTFENQKIFTVLPEYEILRLYDNVPLTAKAQTLLGNRMVYGNYIEGYNLVDRFNNAVQYNFSSELKTAEVGLLDVTTTTDGAQYSIDAWINIPNSQFVIDLGNIDLVKGAFISFDISIDHNSFGGQAPFPTETTNLQTISFSYLLQQNFTSVFALATDSDFIEKIGTAANIQTVANSCNGNTFTDEFNCAIPNQLDAYLKKASGISAVDQGINIFASTNSTDVGFQFPSMQFVDNINAPTQTFYEYYSIVSTSVLYTKTSNNYSLHSNRGYEIGIVYMDEFNRSSTAQVSPFNTTHVACGNSAFINSIQVTIPGGGIIPAQIAPFWAKRYKFVIKADKDTYNTIYTNLYFEDPDSNVVYFLLEGENAKKTEEGDRLIVKSDTNGALRQCAFTTVLEKKSQTADFLKIPDPLQPSATDKFISIPSGVYMKLNPNNFSVQNDSSAGGNIVSGPLRSETADRSATYPVVSNGSNSNGFWSNSKYRLYSSSGK